jgi:hypothetical protein
MQCPISCLFACTHRGHGENVGTRVCIEVQSGIMITVFIVHFYATSC